MKKLLSMLLAILMVISIFSCAEPDNTPTEFTITYTGDIERAPDKVTAGEKYKLPDDLPEPEEGYKLVVKMGGVVLEAGKEYEIKADTELKCSWEKIKLTLTIDGVARTIEYGDTYNIDKTSTDRTLISVSVDGESFEEDSIIIKKDTKVDYVWECTISYTGLDSVPDNAKSDFQTIVRSNEQFKIPYIKGYYIDSVKVNGEDSKPGNAIKVDKNITLTYSVEKGTEGITHTEDANNADHAIVSDVPDKSDISEIVIPDMTEDGKLITCIGETAFLNHRYITTVKLPENLEIISADAFTGCTLTSLNIPAGVKTINGNIIRGCKNLESVTVDTANENFKIIEENGTKFLVSKDGKRLITSLDLVPYPNPAPEDGSIEITIPDGIEVIGERAFYLRQDILSVNMHGSVKQDSVKKIEEFAFEDCGNMTGITMSSELLEIGRSAFESCSSLKSLKIPDKVKSIGLAGFYDCTGITETIIIPASVVDMGQVIFNGCHADIQVYRAEEPSSWFNWTGGHEGKVEWIDPEKAK